MKCARCGKAWEQIGHLRVTGFLAGFDGSDHPILLQLVDCECHGTMTGPVERAVVERAAAEGSGRVQSSAVVALEDLELHLADPILNSTKGQG